MLKQVQKLDIDVSMKYFTVIMLKYLNNKLTHLVLEMLTLLKRCVSLDRPHDNPVHVPVSNKDSRRVGILRRLLVENVEKHGMISGNVKKYLKTIHG